MASRFIMPTADVGSGITPSDGATLTFTETGTDTPKDTFTTEAATVANSNPVVADATGVFPDIFLVGTYRVRLKDKNGVQTGFGVADPVTADSAALTSYNQGSANAVDRTLEDKNQEIISIFDFIGDDADGTGATDYQTGIVNAVAEANTRGAFLLWPHGVGGRTYLTSATIPNLHDVTHVGPGIIKRGSDLFHITPDPTTTNIIYASLTGSATNDGLSSSEPISTLQGAIDVLPNYGPLLKGTWAIQLTAATFARGRFPDGGLLSDLPIEVRGVAVGGHPNVPTTKVTEGANGITAEGIRIREGTRVKCSNILFEGFNGSTASGGFTAGDDCEATTDNCHFTNCTFGVSGAQYTHVDVKGGIFDGNGFDSSAVPFATGAGIRGLFHTKFSVGTQSAGDLTQGPILRNNNFGVYTQEHVNGHLDFCTIEDNTHGVRLNVASRLNMDGTSFKRQTAAAIWAETNSVVSFSSNTVFGTGADANAINTIANTGAVVDPDLMITEAVGAATSERCIERDIINQVVSTTGATVIFQVNLKAELWRDSSASPSGMKLVRFKISGTLNGTTDTKRLQMRFGTSQTSVTFTASETGAFECEGKVFIGVNPIGTQYEIITAFRNGGGGTRVGTAVPTEAMTSDTPFNIEILVGNVADNVTVNVLEVWVGGL